MNKLHQKDTKEIPAKTLYTILRYGSYFVHDSAITNPLINNIINAHTGPCNNINKPKPTKILLSFLTLQFLLQYLLW